MPFLMSVWLCSRPLAPMRLLCPLLSPPLLPPSRFRPRLPPRVGSGCTEAVGAHYDTPPVLLKIFIQLPALKITCMCPLGIVSVLISVCVTKKEGLQAGLTQYFRCPSIQRRVSTRNAANWRQLLQTTKSASLFVMTQGKLCSRDCLELWICPATWTTARTKHLVWIWMAWRTPVRVRAASTQATQQTSRLA